MTRADRVKSILGGRVIRSSGRRINIEKPVLLCLGTSQSRRRELEGFLTFRRIFLSDEELNLTLENRIGYQQVPAFAG